MKQSFQILSRLIVISSFCVISLYSQSTGIWRPITPEELEMKEPLVEKDADAEAIFWEVTLDDKNRGKLFYSHYVRIKIFTERGREAHSKIDIPFASGKKVEDVAARVIKADGTILELSPSEIFEREIIRRGKFKILAKSFAFPGIEPGAIIEYRYKEVFKDDSLTGERLIFQRSIPMQRVTYYIRPYKDLSLQFKMQNMPKTDFNLNREGFYVGTLTNIKALKEEPKMPPEDEVRSWVELDYNIDGRWERFGTSLVLAFSEFVKVTKETEKIAEQLTKNASTPEETVKNIYTYVRNNFRNISFDTSLTDEQKDKIEIKRLSDTINKRMGRESDLNLLFAAIAKAAGFQVSWIFAGDRSENFFNPEKNIGKSNLHPAGILVRFPDGSSKMVNAGNPYLPYGMLKWFEEGTLALIIGETSRFWRTLPITRYIDSSAKRTGKFKLLEDGTLEGKAQIEYDGHQAIGRRMTEYKDSREQREENFKESIKSKISTAEISELSISNFDDPSKPLTYNFKIRIPNYAQKTGKRLIFQPGIFEFGTKPLFTSETRIHPIYFEYPWFEDDKVEIEYPNNFLPDNVVVPGDVNEKNNVSALTIDMTIQRQLGKIEYKRQFYFGNQILLFPASTYPSLKALWDKFLMADSHVISLKQKEE